MGPGVDLEFWSRSRRWCLPLPEARRPLQAGTPRTEPIRIRIQKVQTLEWVLDLCSSLSRCERISSLLRGESCTHASGILLSSCSHISTTNTLYSWTTRPSSIFREFPRDLTVVIHTHLVLTDESPLSNHIRCQSSCMSYSSLSSLLIRSPRSSSHG